MSCQSCWSWLTCAMFTTTCIFDVQHTNYGFSAIRFCTADVEWNSSYSLVILEGWVGRVKHKSVRHGPSLLSQSLGCNRSPVHLLFCPRHGCMAVSECYAKKWHLATAVPYVHTPSLLQGGGKRIFCPKDPLCHSGQASDRGWPPTCQLLGAALQIGVSGFLQPYAWATGAPGCTHFSVWFMDVLDLNIPQVSAIVMYWFESATKNVACFDAFQ